MHSKLNCMAEIKIVSTVSYRVPIFISNGLRYFWMPGRFYCNNSFPPCFQTEIMADKWDTCVRYFVSTDMHAEFCK